MATNKAGAIVVDQEKKHILLIHRLKKDDWSFPKGHIEQGESPETAAKREVLEETGYLIDLKKALPDLIYETDKGERVALKMFLGVAGELSKESEHDIEIAWLEIQDIENRLTYANLKDYWSKVKGGLF